MNPEGTRRKLVETYMRTGSISQTAHLWGTSRALVRKWVRRYQEEGLAGLRDCSRRPRRSPRRTPPEVEAKVYAARKRTGYGRKRLAWYLWREEGLALSPHTLHHILRRQGFLGRKKKRKTLYPVHWAWEQGKPFALVQVDMKDILDKATLGTALWDHLRKTGLPRYQWTFLEGRTRLRFLAWSREVTQTHALCFVGLALLWLRAHGIGEEVVVQTDWGAEFGGYNPRKIAALQQRYFASLGARLARIPLGKKEYNGRVERSHRTDGEEFYIPFLGQVRTEEEFLKVAAGWVYYYNLVRPHYGKGMEGKPPFLVLQELGYALPQEFAVFPPLILDKISADWVLSMASRGGNDVLAHYSVIVPPFFKRPHVLSSESLSWNLSFDLHSVWAKNGVLCVGLKQLQEAANLSLKFSHLNGVTMPWGCQCKKLLLMKKLSGPE
ncbi:MAG: helix-turn-helix domain-containing protein [Candidatus Hadarchaeum sp.]|uniref:helix-turn-helix domain-containing protein n=1 Tax=Candidatus Hadarchaeum sp. TaxID=2883567 RepID=UPI003170C6EC